MIPAEQAFENAKRAGRCSKWPNRSAENRLEPECWPQFATKFQLRPTDTVFTIGSCFARNIEEYFDRLGFRLPMLEFEAPSHESPNRPNGILNKYTPATIHQELEWTARILDRDGLVTETDIAPFTLVQPRGMVSDLGMGGPPVTPERALERRRQSFEAFRHAFTAEVVVITLGLIEDWWDSANQIHLNSTPDMGMIRKYPGRFLFNHMDFEQALKRTVNSLELLNRDGERNILLTVSPVPLRRSFTGDDVIVANTYSKSVLRAVAGQMEKRYQNVTYFPSYETVMLTRQADVWVDDLIHVRDEFVGKIVRHIAAILMPEGVAGVNDVFQHLVEGDAETASTLLVGRDSDDVELARVVLGVLEDDKDALTHITTATLTSRHALHALEILLKRATETGDQLLALKSIESFNPILLESPRVQRLAGDCLAGFLKSPVAKPVFNWLIESNLLARLGVNGVNHLLKAPYTFHHDTEIQMLLDSQDEGFLSALNALTLRKLGNFLLSSGETDRALQVARLADEKSSEDSRIALLLARTLTAAGDLKEAESVARRAVALEETDLEAWLALIEILLQRDSVEEALNAVDDAMDVDPNNPRLLNRRAGILFRKGDFEASEATCREALSLNPDMAAAWQRLSMALAAQDQHTAAIKAARRAVDLMPENAKLRAWMASFEQSL